MTEERKAEIYASLVTEIEAAHKEGLNIGTRQEIRRVLIGWFGQINSEHLEIIERLHADNWIDD